MSVKTDQPAGQGGCAAVRCQATANISIDLFMALLEQTAEKSDGKLSIDQIRTLSETIKQAPGKLATLYEQTYADCTSQAIELRDPRSEIRNPFRQLMITQISTGLVHNLPINRDRNSALFSPRLLKAFVKGLERLMPRRFVARANTKAMAIEARLRKTLGDNQFSWQAYCQDPEAHMLLAEIIVELSLVFKAFGKGTAFLISEVNGLLGNVRMAKGVYLPGQPEIFGEQQCRRALKAMIEDFCDEADVDASDACMARVDEATKRRIGQLYRKVA